MASQLFVQYLLSNETQIAYSQTEGYVPVTSKAQGSAEYLDYISRSGQDNDLYYNIKIDAAKMLMENVDNTFTTAVFNGSTSLRNAAGEMIEKVVKSVRRKEKINDKYYTRLYSDVRSLYRLDRIETSDMKIRLGEMPAISVALLCSISVTWIGLIGYFIFSKTKRRKN